MSRFGTSTNLERKNGGATHIFTKQTTPFLGFEGHLMETCHSLSFEDLEGSISDLARWKGGNQTIKTQHVF
jgi:hypothetical protein